MQFFIYYLLLSFYVFPCLDRNQSANFFPPSMVVSDYNFIPGVAGTRRNAKGDGPAWTAVRVKKSRVNSDVNRRKGGARGRRRGPRGRGKGRMQIYGSAYGQLKRDIGWLMSVVNVEDKYIDTAGPTTLSAAWQLFLLNGCVTGTSATTRNGQSIKLVGWEYKFFLTIDPASTTVQSARIVVFFDRQCNAAAPTPATDIYPATVASMRIVSQIPRYAIIYDEWIVLDPSSPSGVVGSLNRALQTHVEFNTTNGGTVADITKNSMYLMVLSDAGASFPVLVWSSRVVFVDN